MLEKIDLKKTLEKERYKTLLEEYSLRLSKLQREAKALQIPVSIVFEGWGASGKGTLINRLIAPLDPRGFDVYTTNKTSEEESMRPYLWRFWTRLPENGRIAIFDRSWYRIALSDRIDGITTDDKLAQAYTAINSFERVLADDGMLIIKFFLHISKKEQKKRFKKLAENKETAWRVTKDDWQHHKNYDRYFDITNETLEKTDNEFAPWNIIEAIDGDFAIIKIMSVVIAELAEAIEKKKNPDRTDVPNAMLKESELKMMKSSVLDGADLSLSLTKEEYKERLKKAQKKLRMLHNECYLNRIPVVLAFEGWDAGGKGGAIKRLTERLDPRGYRVIPTAAPNDIEKKHHYLWRFWNAMPKDGHIAIFDRTWYGRVMVERLEGFCTKNEWQRAYREMNMMEEHLAKEGAVVIKFWMHIDKDEQERRFKERQENPDKQWKITDEDWRNREKWEQYEIVVNEMILKTSTTYAPWIIVEGNSKYYARIKVLETVIDALEKALEKKKDKR